LGNVQAFPLTLGVVGGFGCVLSRQFNEFAAQVPHYSNTIKQKFATLRASRKGAIADVQKTVEEVSSVTEARTQAAQLLVTASIRTAEPESSIGAVRLVESFA
jgi:methylthioribose-1-phosphate isomerase